jgi:hypothetical protein
MGASPGNVRVLTVESRSRDGGMAMFDGRVKSSKKTVKNKNWRDSSTTAIKQKSKLGKQV